MVSSLPAPGHAKSLPQGSRRVVVRHTFLEVVDSAAEETAREGLGRRACSDPTLSETAAQQLRLRERAAPPGCRSPEAAEAEFELAGLSDTETSSDVFVGRASLLCCEHLQEERQVSSGATTCSRAASELSSDEPHPACNDGPSLEDITGPCLPRGSGGGMDMPCVPGSTRAPRIEMAQLVSENARLALENKLLRENVRLAWESSFFSQEDMAPASAAGEPKEPSSHYHTDTFPGQTYSECSTGIWCSLPAVLHPMPTGQQSHHIFVDHGDAGDPPTGHGQDYRAAAQHADTMMHAANMHDLLADIEPDEVPLEKRTTVMLRNLPNNYSRAMVLAMLNDRGFAGLYDFLYLPIDFNSHACLGYAFVNLTEPAVVLAFWSAFNGFSDWILPSRKVCRVSWSGPHQGLAEHLARYRSSPVMHSSVPDEYKPVLFTDGVRVMFPAPTKTPRAPRIRHHADSKNRWPAPRGAAAR